MSVPIIARSQAQAPFWLGVDVGGTNLKAGVVDDRGVPLSKVVRPTEAARGPEIGIDNIAQTIEMSIVQSGLSRDEIQGIGLATPGTMDIPGGMLLDPPNLPGWKNVPIRQAVADRCRLPTVLQNDANAAAYGEFWTGAARDAQSLVFWTLGTGVGCGIIIGDLIVEGAHSTGGECGHIIIEMQNGRLCGTGQFGTLEAYAGAKAVVLRCQEAIRAGRGTVLKEWIADGTELTPLLISEAAEAGDAMALDLILETARLMGVGTVTVMHTIDPEMVLIGGAMTFGGAESSIGRQFLDALRAEVRRRTFPVLAEKTIIDYARLGNDAGYIGAAGCARLKLRQPTQVPFPSGRGLG